jgi:hypothetical protein
LMCTKKASHSLCTHCIRRTNSSNSFRYALSASRAVHSPQDEWCRYPTPRKHLKAAETATLYPTTARSLHNSALTRRLFCLHYNALSCLIYLTVHFLY